MKPINVVFGLVLMCSLCVACNTSTQGPTIWLDSPLDGESLPLAPLTIQAHASDADGVAKIEFYVAAVKVAEVSAGGTRLGEASYEWTPSANGAYIISARAIDNKGEVGNMTSASITIGASIAKVSPTLTMAITLPAQVKVTNVECGAGQKVGIDFQVTSPKGVISVEAYSTWVATKESKLTYQSPYPLKVTEKLWIEEPYPDDIDRVHQVGVKAVLVGMTDPIYGFGDEPGPEKRCPGHYQAQPTLTLTPEVSLKWIAIQDTNCRSGPGIAYDVITFILTGESVPIEGKNSDSSWFVVRKPDMLSTCWVSIGTGTVEGDLSQAPVVSAPPLPTEPPPGAIITVSPIDTIAPSITGYSLDPDTVIVEGGGCSSSPRTSTISATVTDDGGVNRVVANIQGYGEVEMYSAGGNLYQATLGSYSQAATFTVYIVATDNAGNSSQQGPLTLTVMYCIE